jgi:predicted ATP-grasp superfamily ATP-dependent carboligase
LGIPVDAVQRNALIPSGVSRYLTGKFFWTGDPRNREQFLEGIAAIRKRLGRPAVLVPADDLSSIQVAEHANLLGTDFRFARPPTALPRSVANKLSLYKLCQRLGVACPSTHIPTSLEELREAARRTPLPVVVKVVEPWLAPRGFKSTVIISKRQDLISYCEDFIRQASPTTLMIQEMIPAATSEDWFVHGYCDSRSNPVAVFTGVKLRSYPAFAGPTTYARSVRNEALQEQVSAFLTGIDYQGILDLDFKFDKRDGRYKLLDFNPRVGAQFRLFVDADGTDVVRVHYSDLTGQGSEVGAQIEERTFVAEIQDLVASRSYRQRYAHPLRNWWRTLRQADETAWYDPDDPLPFLLMCLHLPLRGVSRLLHSASTLRKSKVTTPLKVKAEPYKEQLL